MMRQEAAEVLALQALGWIAGDPDRLGGFLAATGSAPADLRRAAADPAFLGAVLDHLLADDAAVLAFSAETGVAPEMPMRARMALPGGAAVHWT